MNKSHLLLPMDTTDLDQALIEDVTKLFHPEAFTLNILHVTAIPDMTWQDYDDLIDNNQDTSDIHTIEKDCQKTAPEYSQYNQQAKRLEQLLLKQLETTQTHFEAKGFDVRCNIAFGEAAKAIISFAEAKDLDLIIMSKHNRKSLPRLNIGSVTEKVLKTATVPVLLLRPLTLPKEKA